MSKIRLFFVKKDDGLYLNETEFTSFFETYRSIRGRCVRRGYGSFQLRPGVFAIQRLLVSYAITLLEDKELTTDFSEVILLQGGRGSLASSLDNALNKPPQWLIQMFGSAPDGSSNLNGILKRENSGYSMQGPVRFMVRSRSIDDLAIFLDGVRINHIDSLKNVLQGLPGDTNLNEHYENAVHDPRDYPHIRSLIKRAYIAECTSTFSRANLLSTAFINNTENEISGDSWFHDLERNFKYIKQVDESLCPSLRMGNINLDVIQRELNKLDIIEIYCSTYLAAHAITENLNRNANLNIVVNSSFANGYDISNLIAQGIVSRYPEACVMTLATGSYLINTVSHPRYIPAFFMPSISSRVLSPVPISSEKLYRGSYAFFDRLPSGPRRYYNSMCNNKFIDNKNSSACHMDDYDITEHLGSKRNDFRAIQWFPFSDLNRILNDCHFVDRTVSESSLTKQILFVREDIFKTNIPLILNAAFRSSWLNMVENPKNLDNAIEHTLNNSQYITAISRYSGRSMELMEALNPAVNSVE